MRLSELLAAAPGVLAHPARDAEVSAPVVEDSREVAPGGVFVARVGGSADGHRFIAQAVAAGAAAIVGERRPAEVVADVPYAQVADARAALPWLSAAYHGFPARRLVMVGVTGTDGKTTTAHLIYHILRAAGLRAGMISTVKAVLGDKDEADTGLHVTTPPAPHVQAYLARMVSAGLTHCVLEATSHGLAQHRVDACAFDIAVMTNVTHEHLDFHGSWKDYRDAKARLFALLGAEARKPDVRRWAILNHDDPSCAHFLSVSGHDAALTYSAEGATAADLHVTRVESTPATIRFAAATPGGVLAIESRLAGLFNVANILAAAGAALALGVAPEAIKRGVAETPSVPGRMERIDEGQPFLALVDFAHTPHALKRALEAARDMAGEARPPGRVIAVFGSAGLRDREKRRLMAKTSAALADLTVLTAEDPRTESLDAILAEMAAGCANQGGVEGVTFWRVPDRGEALAFACRLACPGDVVISCGKGHEQSMCFGTTEYPWDDREALRAALRGQPLHTLPTARPENPKQQR